MRILVTGGAGFVGHQVVARLLFYGHDLTLLERLSHSGNLNRLDEIGAAYDVTVVHHDLRSPIGAQLAKQIGPQDACIHLAALTHVDRAIADPMAAVLDNVVATCNLLEWARTQELSAFVQFSTDEVFGPAPAGVAYREWDRYKSGNPYAATKAGAEELALSYHNTFGLPVVITHTMNIIGERQHPEKFLPLVVRKVLAGETVQIHADPTRKNSGSRHWIHAADVADAVAFLLSGKAKSGEKYNIVGEELTNLALALYVADALDRPLRHELVDFHSARPGHDLRYALDGGKMAGMGWKPPAGIGQRIRDTARWFRDNPRWL